MPAAFSASEYNTKCLPTLLYVSQLCSPPPHILQTELGAIHKILHLPPQTFSYNLAIILSSLIGFNIRSASTAMNASMIRFALKSFPSAEDLNQTLIQNTLDCVPFKYLSPVNRAPLTPGWDTPAYVSNLATAMRQDCQPDTHRDHGADFAEYMRRIRCTIERNGSIKELAIQKQLYSILIGKIHNGWNPLVSKRLGDYGIDSQNLDKWLAYQFKDA